MLVEVGGNLITLAKKGEFDIIAHGANCFHLMKSGIAPQIVKAFPSAEVADKETPHGSWNKLGSISIGKEPDGIYIANLYTQFQPGPYASLAAVELCFWKLDILMKQFKLERLGIPLIGCGIGGLQWEDVKALAKKHLSNVTVVHYIKEN